MKTCLFSLLFAALAGSAFAADEKEPATTKSEAGRKKKDGDKKTLELHVVGMSCSHCAEAVEEALAAVAGVTVKSVDPKSCLATVVYDPSKADEKKMTAAVKATEEYAVASKVDYSKLEYENDGTFSLGGKPFTGTAVDSHKNGKQSKSYMFEKGLLNGLIREWYDSGQIAASKIYRRGKRHGETKYWDEKGKLTATKLYKDDEHVEEEKGAEAEEK